MATPAYKGADFHDTPSDQLHAKQQTILPPTPAPRSTPRPKRILGYECVFVEPPPKAFQVDCPICLHVLREPVQVTCCGYNFCRACIETVQTERRPCPTCADVAFTVFHNKGLQRSLNGFVVRCPHYESLYQNAGCGWVGELGQLERHLQPEPGIDSFSIGCEYVEVKCTHGCGRMVRRGMFKEHFDSCPGRRYTCEYCHDYESTHEDVVNVHWPVCKSYPVPCPNKCDLAYAIERQNLGSHLKGECPLAIIDCDFRYAGCEIRLPRKDMPGHYLETNSAAHLSMIAVQSHRTLLLAEELRTALEESKSKIESLEADNQVYKSANKALQQEVDTLKKRYESLESKCSALCSHCHIAPVNFIMTAFSRFKEKEETWYSKPFYTHPQGYKMQLGVIVNSSSHRFGQTYPCVSVHVCLLRGEFDENLDWPFRGCVTVQLQNQLSEQNHYVKEIVFNDRTPERCAGRVFHSPARGDRYGLHPFITHADLLHQRSRLQYLKDDRLCFCVLVDVN